MKELDLELELLEERIITEWKVLLKIIKILITLVYIYSLNICMCYTYSMEYMKESNRKTK